MSGEIAGGLLPTGEYGHTLNNPMYDSGRKKNISVHKTFQEDMALEVGKDLKTPEGWGVVVIGYGDDPSQMGPVTVSWNDWVLRFPRNSRRAIPPGHFNVLMDAVETKYHQAQEGAPLVGYEVNRYNVQVLKVPDSSPIDKDKVNEKVERVEVA
ncbi:MAG: hypothetical protein CL886_00245 [Dehalococcoidia bacterium]|nr:hypothetical protein [Dehalococcoidia bacterium]|tara:strand:+ start:429 stop:890 length:462 start_codon:yes stop_codon:yes gene_type:complete